MRYNVHAGHNAAGKVACGAVSILDESKENRKVVKELIRLLRVDNTVYDCTVSNAKDVNANLREIVAKCNSHEVDLDISIHFNSGAKDKKGNGKTTGTEVWVTEAKGVKRVAGENICKNMERLGFKNRGVKETKNLYVLNRTNAKAILVEVCFVDDADDAKLYKKVGYKRIARAIAEGIVGHSIDERPKYRAIRNVNIRKAPTTHSDKLGKVLKGETIKGTPVENNWLKTDKGYIRIKGLKTYLIKEK